MPALFTIFLLALTGIALFVSARRFWGSIFFAATLASLLVMLLDHDAFLVMMRWIQRLFDVGIVVFLGYRVLLFVAGYIDDIHDALMETRDALNEIRDELRDMRRQVALDEVRTWLEKSFSELREEQEQFIEKMKNR